MKRYLPFIIIRDSTDEFVTIEFARRGGETLVFQRKETISATAGILTDNGVQAKALPM